MKKIKETPTEKYLREILELLKLKASQPIFPPYSNFNGCPPHNFVPYQYQGTWGGSVSPPTMRCTKCLMTA